MREELLRAMLNADLIGFLLFEYTRNFVACCKRLLGLDHEFKRGGFLGVEHGGRHVMLQVSTFGVSPSLLQKHMAPPPSAAATGEIKTAATGELSLMQTALAAQHPQVSSYTTCYTTILYDYYTTTPFIVWSSRRTIRTLRTLRTMCTVI